MTFPAQFGRYTLKRRLGEGGMGEVFLASMRGGIEGVEKVCVIKRLRRMYTHDQEFVTRFLDEARLMVQLSHANIVPVFDAGELDGDYFLAMEHVDGADLRELVDTALKNKTHLPQAVALLITREVLGALHYAHRKKDKEGRPLGLVHRDISPQNILCSMAGEVKLIDFGLAKSTQKALKTDPRVVLGKYAYMSPEQARGQPVDGRSDLFAVGLLLFEMLTNRKLFDGVTVGELMEQIAEHRVFRPTKVRPEVDPGVDDLVEHALLKDAKARFQTAEEFRDAVTVLLTRIAPSVSADELSAEVRKVRGLPPAGQTGIHPVPPVRTNRLSGQAPVQKAPPHSTANDELTEPAAEGYSPPPRSSPHNRLAPSTSIPAPPVRISSTRNAVPAPDADVPEVTDKDAPAATPLSSLAPSEAPAPAARDPRATAKWVALALGVGALTVGAGAGIYALVKAKPGDTAVGTTPGGTDPGTSGSATGAAASGGGTEVEPKKEVKPPEKKVAEKKKTTKSTKSTKKKKGKR
jgi:serine/threonine protein kinase